MGGGGGLIHGVLIKLAISILQLQLFLSSEITSNYNHCSTANGISFLISISFMISIRKLFVKNGFRETSDSCDGHQLKALMFIEEAPIFKVCTGRNKQTQ